jgi:hypothetical protein
MKKAALVLMARAPDMGRVKTRLQPVLSPGQCADLYEAFLGDAIALASSMEGFISFVAYTPATSAPIFERLAPPNMEILPQRGDDLGRVMDNLINDLFSRGFPQVILAGSDIPTLQPQTVRRSITLLEKSDVCLGPSRDGGYYLIGATKPVSELFQGVPWSTPGVLRLTLDNAKLAGLSVGLLEEMRDVDVPEDLAKLADEIAALRKVKGSRIPERTETWLKNNRLNFKGGTGAL